MLISGVVQSSCLPVLKIMKFASQAVFFDYDSTVW
jgi:hypothetical protein